MNDEVIEFLNANINNISRFEGNNYHIIIHLKNGEMIEFYANQLNSLRFE